MGIWRCVLALMVASCGRLDFTEHSNALACGSAARFEINAGGATALAATDTPDGYLVFTADGAYDLYASAFTFASHGLAADAIGVHLDSDVNGSIAAASNGHLALLSSMDHTPATATTLFAFGDALGQPSKPVIHDGELSASLPLAAAGTSGRFAFATMESSGDVQLRSVDATGKEVAAGSVVVPAATLARNVAIASSAAGYVIAYQASAPEPDEAQVELVDDSLKVVAGPVSLQADPYGGPYRVGVAWARRSNVYLVSWHAKDVTDDDDVWIELLDSSLTVLMPPVEVATFSQAPRLASDGVGFWLVWDTYSPSPYHLGAAYVDPAGTITPRAVDGSGGTPGGWDLIVHDDQVVLAWTEKGGSGPDLYFDPLCGP